MKKFFTAMSLQPSPIPDKFHYKAEGNQKLHMEQKTSFPIITAMNGYLEPGEEYEIVAVIQANDAGRNSFETFKKEVEDISKERGAVCRKLHEVWIGEDQYVSTHTETFQKLIAYVEDDDELFCCMTFGTKPQSNAILMAVQYAYRIKSNTTIDCVVYGEIKRPSPDKSTWKAFVYDMTALIQLDEIVRVLADRGVENPKEFIDQILSL